VSVYREPEPVQSGTPPKPPTLEKHLVAIRSTLKWIEFVVGTVGVMILLRIMGIL
jgi:hypothetical protein